ncbi:FabG Dehydrogenases with different specificities (related to short-chain alcohol dehydrogenases) [Acidimicrobiia bacterium]
MVNENVTVVIGADRGIGRAIFDGLRNAVSDDGTSDVVVGLGDEIDFADPSAVAASFAEIATRGTINRVVFCFIDESAFTPAPIIEMDEAAWDAAGERSLRAALITFQEVHRNIADGGRVVLVLPTVGAVGVADLVPLCSAVEGVRVMAKAVARRWGARSITVNTIEVELSAFILGDEPVGDRVLPAVATLGASALPAGSATQDVVGLIDMLSTDAGGALTGALLVADRGTVMQP